MTLSRFVGTLYCRASKPIHYDPNFYMNRMMKLLAGVALLIPLSLFSAQEGEKPGLERSPSPPGASLSFAVLEDGDVVQSTFPVAFEVTGLTVVPAGTESGDSGHHHLLIDVEELPPMDLPLPSTEQIRHFGGGETSTHISLPPGEHTLQLLFADDLHIPHDPPVMSEKITITVSE